MKTGNRFIPFFSLFLLIHITCLLSLFSQEKFRKLPPYPEPLAHLKLPEVESASLSNGLTFSVIHKDNLPVINVRLIIFTGESSSPEEFPGTATFTVNMLNRGTLRLSSSEIEEVIESIGGNFSATTYSDYSVFNFTFLEEYLDEALDLLSNMILQSTFARREIDNVKRFMFYDLLKKRIDPEFIAKRHLFRMLFKDHPYKKITFSEDVIKRFDQKTLLAFFNTYYRPNNALFILTGNLNLSIASRKISHYFQTWGKKELPNSVLTPPEPLTQTKEKICYIDLPKAKDTTIYLGNIVNFAESQDIFPFAVLNQMIGGTPNSRLFMNLRESKGYAYFAFSELEFFKTCSIFYIKEKVRPEVTHASVKETLREIEQTIKEKAAHFEIEQAKSYLIGNFPLQIETFDSLSFRLCEINVFSLGKEHWNKYYENIMLVDSEKVFEVAKKYLLLSPVVVIVGDKKNMSDYIRQFDEVDVYDHKGVLQYTIKGKEN